MNYKIYRSSIHTLLEEADQVLSSGDNDERYIRKVHAIRSVLLGGSKDAIAKDAGVTIRSLQAWLKTADEQGFSALKSRKHQIRSPKLTQEQLTELSSILFSTYPYEHGNSISLIWTAEILVRFIQEKYSVSVSTRKCRDILLHSGYSKSKLKETLGYYNNIFLSFYKRFGEDQACQVINRKLQKAESEGVIEKCRIRELTPSHTVTG